MNETRLVFLKCLLSAALFASMPAWATSSVATLRQVQGTVLVEHAAGYRRATNGTELQLGERLLVLEGASAVVVSRSGCVVRLAENGHFVVGRSDDCSAVVQPAAATLLAQAIGFEPTGPKSDVGTDGFGAIGAEPHTKLTPMDIKRAEEAVDAKTAKSLETGGSKAVGATPAGGGVPTAVVAARKPLRANAPSKDSGESFFTGGSGSVAAVAGVIAGGVGLIAALAGGGGGGGGGGGAGGADPAGPPISPGKPSQNNGGGNGGGSGGGGTIGGGQPPVLSPQ